MTAKTNDRSVLEATLESGEVVLDVFLNGEVLADIPFIGTAIKICRANDTMRQGIYAAKLARFINDLSSVPQSDIEKIRLTVNSSGEEARRVGETVLMILEQVTDMDKPIVLARLLLCYAEGVISSVELRRLYQAINSAFMDDIKEFLAVPTLGNRQAAWMENLVTAGLTKLAVGISYDTDGEIYFDPSPLGERLRAAHCHRPLI